MGRHRSIVARGFQVAAILFGIPSLVGLVTLLSDLVVVRLAPHPAPTHNIGIERYGLVALLWNAANGIGSILGFLVGAATWLMGLVAAGLLALVVLAAVLYIIGRGIGRRSMWARVVGLVIPCGTVLVSAPLLLWGLQTSHPVIGFIAAIPTSASLYTLWALIWKFA